jgi:hypothetical protein
MGSDFLQHGLAVDLPTHCLRWYARTAELDDVGEKLCLETGFLPGADLVWRDQLLSPEHRARGGSLRAAPLELSDDGGDTARLAYGGVPALWPPWQLGWWERDALGRTWHRRPLGARSS